MILTNIYQHDFFFHSDDHFLNWTIFFRLFMFCLVCYVNKLIFFMTQLEIPPYLWKFWNSLFSSLKDATKYHHKGNISILLIMWRPIFHKYIIYCVVPIINHTLFSYEISWFIFVLIFYAFSYRYNHILHELQPYIDLIWMCSYPSQV